MPVAVADADSRPPGGTSTGWRKSSRPEPGPGGAPLPGHTTSETDGGGTGTRAMDCSALTVPAVSTAVTRTTSCWPALVTAGALKLSVDPLRGKVTPGIDGPDTSDHVMPPLGARLVIADRWTAAPAAAVGVEGPIGVDPMVPVMPSWIGAAATPNTKRRVADRPRLSVTVTSTVN